MAYQTIQYIVESTIDALTTVVGAGLAVLPGDFEGARGDSASEQGKVVKELRTVQNVRKRMSIRVETGNKTLDRIIREEARIVIDKEKTRKYNNYRAGGI